MSELLYNKSKAVEELNKVEGFYPLELARVISNEGQEEQRYLDVKYRKLWFRLVKSYRQDYQPDCSLYRKYGSRRSQNLSG